MSFVRKKTAASATKIIAFHVVAVAIIVAVIIVAAMDMSGTKQAVPDPTRDIPVELRLWQASAPVALADAEATGLAIADGKAYVVSADRLDVYDLTGAKLTSWPLDKPARRIAAGPDGRLFVNHDMSLSVINPKTGQTLETWPTGIGDGELISVAVSGQNVYASDYPSRSVVVWDLQGNRLRTFDGKTMGGTGFKLPSRNFPLAVGPEGLLRAANPGELRVEAYGPDGQRKFTWGRAGEDVTGFCGCCNPVAMAIFPDGRVVTAEKALPTVKVFTDRQDGTLASVVAGPDAFGPHMPADVAIDPSGRVWVLVPGKQQIQIYQKQPQQESGDNVAE